MEKMTDSILIRWNNSFTAAIISETFLHVMLLTAFGHFRFFKWFLSQTHPTFPVRHLHQEGSVSSPLLSEQPVDKDGFINILMQFKLQGINFDHSQIAITHYLIVAILFSCTLSPHSVKWKNKQSRLVSFETTVTSNVPDGPVPVASGHVLSCCVNQLGYWFSQSWNSHNAKFK